MFFGIKCAKLFQLVNMNVVWKKKKSFAIRVEYTAASNVDVAISVKRDYNNVADSLNFLLFFSPREVQNVTVGKLPTKWRTYILENADNLRFIKMTLGPFVISF